MYKHLKFTSTLNMGVEDWLSHRKIGGSDISTIFNMNDFKPALKLFHEKIGYTPEYQQESLATYTGKVLEDVVEKNFWRYWDPQNPTVEKMIENALSGNVVRKCQNFNKIIENPDYPWLTANVDRLINKNQNGRKRRGVLEIKTGLGFAVQKYEGGIHPGWIMQMQTYLLITGLPYAELMYLKDGRYPEWYVFERNETIIESIIEKTRAFWELVEEGRKIMNSNMSPEEKSEAIAYIEPEPDGTSACEEYLKERYRATDSPLPLNGTQEHLQWAIDYLKCTRTIKETETEKKRFANLLRQLFINTDTDTIDWGEIGIASWKKNAKGNPTLYVQPKILKVAEELNLI